MPLYEYRAVDKGCSKCSNRFEVLQKKSEPETLACPQCGAQCTRVISVFSVGGSGGSDASPFPCGEGSCGAGPCGDTSASFGGGGCGAGGCGLM